MKWVWICAYRTKLLLTNVSAWHNGAICTYTVVKVWVILYCTQQRKKRYQAVLTLMFMCAVRLKIVIKLLTFFISSLSLSLTHPLIFNAVLWLCVSFVKQYSTKRINSNREHEECVQKRWHWHLAIKIGHRFFYHFNLYRPMSFIEPIILYSNKASGAT